MNEVIIGQNLNNRMKNFETEVLEKKFKKKFCKNRKFIINGMVEAIKGVIDLTDKIDLEKKYIVKFPTEIIEKINLGQYEVMKSKKGEILSMIVDKTLPSNKNIVHQLRLEEIETSKLQNLTGNITNIALEQQLAEFSEILKKIENNILDIKRGQMINRIGLIKSGKLKLEQAMELDDSNLEKRKLIINAISGLNDGRTQIELYLKEKLKKKIVIPDKKLMIIWEGLKNKNYYNDIENEFNEIQEGVEACFEATYTLALAYELIESKEAIAKVFTQLNEVIDSSAEELERLSPMLMEIESNACWYKQKSKLIEEINEYTKLEKKKSKYISMEVLGQELIGGIYE
ncbi:MAG: hypothetical protein ACRC28_02555 [Clostridium sp.]|uniref:hypothetical protein n=1 Tax=Clostridium sp. TaxID=1506 RepID=UPI003F3B5B57